ncbi:Hsp20/alpha crystallin family protein [Lewinella sp. JB7]|uniref:Hsp20/alpha crystallin family protein n=1 Tax=Lewinella sp. JB7 TaxID=2962887 RepID=UPI0020C9D15E|nr:Hsp20/alpha crystallin family protein [Lewinella sp. JB7]MCP9235660.1 Hsp20/alpha crystallin family protein [Lewinella sp. JB7]
MNIISSNRPFPASFRFFDDQRTRTAQTARPAVNIIEHEDHFTLEMYAPGRNKEWFSVDFFEGTLEVSYTMEKTGDEPDVKYVRREFETNDFSRRFKLNDEVIDDTAIEANYEDGLLRLTLPKREPVTKQVRQIAVA